MLALVDEIQHDLEPRYISDNPETLASSEIRVLSKENAESLSEEELHEIFLKQCIIVSRSALQVELETPLDTKMLLRVSNIDSWMFFEGKFFCNCP